MPPKRNDTGEPPDLKTVMEWFQSDMQRNENEIRGVQLECNAKIQTLQDKVNEAEWSAREHADTIQRDLQDRMGRLKDELYEAINSKAKELADRIDAKAGELQKQLFNLRLTVAAWAAVAGFIGAAVPLLLELFLASRSLHLGLSWITK